MKNKLQHPRVLLFIAATLCLPLASIALAGETIKVKGHRLTSQQLAEDTATAGTVMDGETSTASDTLNQLARAGIDSLTPPKGRLELITVSDIFFEHNKAILSERSKKLLDETADYLRHNNTVQRVLIDGHTDSVAGDDFNFNLSDRRALVVRDYLVKQGVSAEKLWINGWGESRPIDENWTRYGRQTNRRVEVYIVLRQP